MLVKMNRKHLLITTAFIAFSQCLMPFPAQAEEKRVGLNQEILKCLKARTSSGCLKALLLLETLQNKAAFMSNYSCQTYSLALGSELIMNQLNANRKPASLAMLKKVNSLCRDIPMQP